MAKGFTEELSTRMLKELDILSRQKKIKVDNLFRKGDGMGNLDADIVYSEILNSFIQKVK